MTSISVRYLGWAGVEVEAGGATVVVDPLADAFAVFAAFGERAHGTPLPRVVPAQPGRAVAGLLTHLHRDHADAAALAAALAPGAPVLEPPAAGGGDLEELALRQADAELDAAGLPRRRVAPGEAVTAGPFTLTALPAVDGLGDPQVSWLVEASGVRVLHLGDTMPHGHWWRMALAHGPFDLVLPPANGARIAFPHRRPAIATRAALDPEGAAAACAALGAALAVPIHHDGYDIAGVYEPVPDAAARFVAAAAAHGVPARVLEPGGRLALTAAHRGADAATIPARTAG